MFTFSTSKDILGYTVTSVIGPVSGVAVRTRKDSDHLAARMRSMIAGALTPENHKIQSAVLGAANRQMRKNAISMGANAILEWRWVTREIGFNVVEGVCSGTAVTVERDADLEIGK